MFEYVPVYLRVGPYVEVVWEEVYVSTRQWVFNGFRWVLV